MSREGAIAQKSRGVCRNEDLAVTKRGLVTQCSRKSIPWHQLLRKEKNFIVKSTVKEQETILGPISLIQALGHDLRGQHWIFLDDGP